MKFQDDGKEIIDYEMDVYQERISESEQDIEIYEQLIKAKQELFKALSAKLGKKIDENNIDEVVLPILAETIDEVSGSQNKLIRKSHYILPYSLVNKQPTLKEFIPHQNPNCTGLELLCAKSTSRAYEIVREYTSVNTKLAQSGDLIYWQAWLSAIGFDFLQPITEKEIVAFIIFHSEEPDHEIDKKLVEQGYKAKYGPHRLATIKRRIATLSVFLDSVKWPNPTRGQAISQLIQKLTKKYGSSKPAGKAITKDILDDMLDTCHRNTRIDIRDKALLLFAWGTGGRRRSEVVAAEMNSLTKLPEGDYIYTIPKSKTDQAGVGHPVPVKGRVAEALTAWLTVSGVTEGPIFRAITKGGVISRKLSDRSVFKIVRKRLMLAHYDEEFYGAHSLRSGWVTEAGRRGKPLGDVMSMTTHRNVSTCMRYYQAGNIKNNSASNLAD